MLSLTDGLPVEENPTNPLEAELLRPSLEKEQAAARASAEWLQNTRQKLNKALLDPTDNLGYDFSKASNPDAARKAALVRGYVMLENQGNPFPAGEIGFQVARDRIAQQKFNGKGKQDDTEFFNQIQAEATQQKTAAELEREMQTLAIQSATVRAVEGDLRAPKFSDWLTDARTKPGYQPGNDFKYKEIWEETKSGFS